MTPDRAKPLPPPLPPMPPSPIVKEIWKASTQLCPVPVVLVSTRDADGRPNIATIAWAGTVSSDPPMLTVSLRPATLTHGILTRTGEFVVNIPSVPQIKTVDYCGMASGRDEDKFAKTGLTPGAASQVKAPLVMECPLNIECRVNRTLELGKHTMFLADILAVHVTKNLINAQGRLAIEEANLAVFAHGHYYALGKQLGHFGYSVRKKPVVKGHYKPKKKNDR